MRHCAANKKLIFFFSRVSQLVSHRLIRSLIDEQATQLYSYKRKLHQGIPITFHGNCWPTLLFYFFLRASLELPQCCLFFFPSNSRSSYSHFNFTCPFYITVISLSCTRNENFLYYESRNGMSESTQRNSAS